MPVLGYFEACGSDITPREGSVLWFGIDQEVLLIDRNPALPHRSTALFGKEAM